MPKIEFLDIFEDPVMTKFQSQNRLKRKRSYNKIIGTKHKCIRKTGKDKFVNSITVKGLIPKGYLSKGHMYWVECFLDNNRYIISHMHYMTIKRKYREF